MYSWLLSEDESRVRRPFISLSVVEIKIAIIFIFYLNVTYFTVYMKNKTTVMIFFTNPCHAQLVCLVNR
jgi:hypothetical protein